MSLVLKQVIIDQGQKTEVLHLPLVVLEQCSNYWSLYAECKAPQYGHPMLVKISTNCHYDNDTYYDILLMDAEFGSPNSEHKLLTEKELLELLGIDMKLLKKTS